MYMLNINLICVNLNNKQYQIDSMDMDLINVIIYVCASLGKKYVFKELNQSKSVIGMFVAFHKT